MKITDITVHPLQAPGRTFVIIQVHTDRGLIGIGEAGLQRRWRALEGAMEHLKRWLIGEDPMRIEYLWQRMWRGGFYPGDRLIGSAISAIDIALWDLRGKHVGVPLFELLGGQTRNQVEVFTSPGYLGCSSDQYETELCSRIQRGSPDAAVELAERFIARGQKYFRLGLPCSGPVFHARQSSGQLAAQIQAVRAAIGDKLEIMVDLHTRLSPEEAVSFCTEIESAQLYVVEDPIRSENPHGYCRLRERIRVPLAAGEQWCGKWEFCGPIENEWIDFARVDVCIAGGITETKKIAAIAESHSVKLLLHNPLSPVCLAASLHLDIACDNAGPQEVLFGPDVLPDVFQCDFVVENRINLTVPTGPGLGVQFDAEAAKRYPAEMTEPPHLHRPDGSFTNY